MLTVVNDNRKLQKESMMNESMMNCHPHGDSDQNNYIVNDFTNEAELHDWSTC